MPFDPINLAPSPLEATTSATDVSPTAGPEKPPIYRLSDQSWTPLLQHGCDFGPDLFEQVSINLIKNPNINSSHLFRADILYDSLNECTNIERCAEEIARLVREYALPEGAFPGFTQGRTIIRQMIPRNPQIDRPIAQTCHFLHCPPHRGLEQNIVVYIPHVADIEELPWYHPSCQALAYIHTWGCAPDSPSSKPDSAISMGPDECQGAISVHFRLFPSQTFPLPSRLTRTAHHLLAVLYRHGQGVLGGYTKRVHHDQMISQQRVQDTYTELKRKHAKRLCDNWIEQTEPSKHVFEDLGIAAFLIELWKDMYLPPSADSPSSSTETVGLPRFPGFVDIGCGNGVLTEVLLLSGYPGWGFDARRRKTWSILSPDTQSRLHEFVLIPQPFFDLPPTPNANPSLLSRALSTFLPASHLHPPNLPWHNGIFPTHTFLVSNHADELTPWTPLLASLSLSPFLAIPCCSHNLSGPRFRAPSVFNSQTADHLAPAFFAPNIRRAKSVAISIATNLGFEDDDCISPALSRHPSLRSGSSSLPTNPIPIPAHPLSLSTSSRTAPPISSSATTIPSQPHRFNTTTNNPSNSTSTTKSTSTPISLSTPTPKTAPPPFQTGDLRTLSPSTRSKQPSAYSSLCDWVAHLATEVGYIPERETLRIPSTRNVAIIGRSWRGDIISGASPTHVSRGLGLEDEAGRRARVLEIARREKADGRVWVERCKGLVVGKGKGKEKGGSGGGGHCGGHAGEG